MCRLLAYSGPPIQIERLIYAPDHSLVAQSYQPRELETALLNADGFGLAWYHPYHQSDPFVYRHTQPIWNDLNLPHLCRFIEAGQMLAYVRSATPGLAVDLHNCQPFSHGPISFIHNGFIEQFRHSLYRPIRDRLGDMAYHTIHGLTDSEHLFALLLDSLERHPDWSLAQGLRATLALVTDLAQAEGVRVAANIILSDGDGLVVCRYDTTPTPPSLYWLRHHCDFPDSTIVASEPLFEADWVPCPANSLLLVEPDGDLQLQPLPSPPPGPTTVPVAS